MLLLLFCLFCMLSMLVFVDMSILYISPLVLYIFPWCLVMPLYLPPLPHFSVFLETDLVVGRASAASRSSLAKTDIRSRLLVYIC